MPTTSYAASWEARRSAARLGQQKTNNLLVPIGLNRPTADGVNFVAAGTDNSANTRTIFRTPKYSGVTDIVIGYANFYQNNPEANFPLGFTFTASIEYPIGTTPVQVFSNAAGSLTITPGRGYTNFDPWPGYIPPDTEFAVKTYVTWAAGTNFPLVTSAGGRNNEWFTKGVTLADNTLNLTAQTPSYASPTYDAGLSFPPMVTGRLKNPTAVLGIVGDSISQAHYERIPDPTWGGNGWQRALRQAIPSVNVARMSMAYTHWRTRNEGAHGVLRNGVTHVLLAMGRNDLSAGTSAATIQTYLQDMAAPFLARGVKVYAMTLTPVCTSSDTFATVANQTISSAPQEAQRVAFNTWLRANWAAQGFSGIFDAAWAVDPTDSGKWSVDSGQIGRRGMGVATLGGGGIASVARPTVNSGTVYGGTQYPVSAGAHPCIVYPHPDDPVQAGGGVVTAATDAGGIITGFTPSAAGSYTIPPLISPQGRWTDDGTHLTMRGFDEVIYRTGFGANRFVI